jgi:glycosyltransferase involved in cell wall biosynthesis
MRTALERTPGVVWHGGMGREAAMDAAAGCDLGLGWRAPELDSSLELSTKVLEYGTLGLPALLNRTPAHEALLGADYPLFVGSADDLVERVVDAVREKEPYELAAARCHEAAAGYSFDRAVERLDALCRRVLPEVVAVHDRPRPLRLGIATHELKFFAPIQAWFETRPEIEVRVDKWPGLREHDPDRSRALIEWADVVLCEWCGPNAVFYSHRKREGQRLLVRLHRFELDAGYAHKVLIRNVDRVACVSPYYEDLTQQRTGWDPAKLTTIPNWVDAQELDRAKLPGARFHLGMIGAVPRLKRLDRALDVLEALRHRDDRFTLFVKSKMPWDLWWIWTKADERAYIRDVLRRIQTTPALESSVVFDAFGPDVASWLRKIGFVLSTSDIESFHVAPVEGMASRALPMVTGWPAAHTVYPEEYLHESTDEIVEHVLAVASGSDFEALGEQARRFVADRYSLDHVCESWYHLVTE